MAVAPGQAQFAAGVLKGIGAPVTAGNIAGFVGWSQAEGGTNWQRNNPLNTTEGAGATSTFNSAGVKGYPNTQVGVAATVKTLLNGDYGGIVGAFKANNPNALAPAIGKSPWGTSGSLAAQTIADTLKGGGISVPSGTTLPALPSTPSAKATTASTTTTGLNQPAFDKANAKYIAGSFLEKSGSNPFGGTNPLIAPGLLTTKAPNPADYQTAQTTLQKVAGVKTPLIPHPAATKIPVAMGNLKGFQAAPGTNFTENKTPQIASALAALGRKLGVTIVGISGYRTPAHSVAVGGFADDPHTKGLAADIGVNGDSRASAAQITNAQLAAVGLWRPFDMNGQDPAEVNHVQLIGTN